MNKILTGYVLFVRIINKCIGWLLAIFLVLMSVFIFWQVFSRFVIGSSLAWSEELARFLMIWVVLLGTALALKKGENIVIDIKSGLVNKKIQKVTNLIGYILSIVFFIVLVIYGWELAQATSSQTAPGLRISMFWAYLSIPVGGIILILNTISLFIEKYIYPKVGEGE